MDTVVFSVNSPEDEGFVIRKCELNIDNLQYDAERLTKFRDLLESEWRRDGTGFVEKIHRLFNLPIDTEPYRVHASGYGPIGHYLYSSASSERHIFINAEAMDRNFYLPRIVKHEIIHLLLEPFVQRYQLDHENKEKLVNAIEESLR